MELFIPSVVLFLISSLMMVMYIQDKWPSFKSWLKLKLKSKYESIHEKVEKVEKYIETIENLVEFHDELLKTVGKLESRIYAIESKESKEKTNVTITRLPD